MKKLIFIFLFVLSSLTVVVMPPGEVAAQGSADALERRANSCATAGDHWDNSRGVCLSACDSGSFLGFPTWYKYFNTATENGKCSVIMPVRVEMDSSNNSKEVTDVTKAVSYVAIAVVEILLRIAALVAVGYIIYGGIRFILSQGEPENAKSARQTVINSLIGLVIALAAGAIVSFIANRLTG